MVIVSSSVFTICDGANVRDGLLSVLSGGINKLVRPEFPTEFGALIAIQLQLESFDAGESMVLEVLVTNADGTDCGIPDFNLDVSDLTTEAGPTPLMFPFILDATTLPIDSPGEYRMALAVNGAEVAHLLFEALTKGVQMSREAESELLAS